MGAHDGKRFVRLALSLHSEEKPATTTLFKDAAAPLIPHNIIHRPGVRMPVAAWLSGPLRPVVEELFTREKLECDGILQAAPIQKMVDEHLRKKRNHRKTLWSLLMFQWWRHRVHPEMSRAT